MLRFLHRQIERLAYAWLLVSLDAGWCVVTLLVFGAPLLRNRKRRKDFLFFPYAHKDNIGTRARFQDYFALLDHDGFTYDVHYPSTREQYNTLYNDTRTSRAAEYWYYHRLFWKRLRAVLTAPRYSAVFFQRALFPEYYNQRRALLEQLLRALHTNITVDYFDADYARNEAFYNKVAALCDKVTVVNQALFDRYTRLHPRVFIHPLSIDCSRYVVKTDYTLHQPLRLFWTGSRDNAEMHLSALMPVLETINRVRPLCLIIVGNSIPDYDYAFIEHRAWQQDTFLTLLAESDIALYPVSVDDVFSRGKVAYKVLEYAATGLPMIASPQGLSNHFVHEANALVAHALSDWATQIHSLANSLEERKRLGVAAREAALQHHDVPASYRALLSVLRA